MMNSTILIADDDATIRRGIQLILESAGHVTVTAADGRAALDILGTDPVSLIIADIAMPNLNGYQLLQAVRQNPSWAWIPFIFLSARALDSDIRFGKELGVDDYLVKPVRGADLLATVRGKLLRSEQWKQLAGNGSVAGNGRLCPKLVAGRLVIAPDERRVWLDQEQIKLSAREFVLLEYLAKQLGRVITLSELVQATHGLEVEAVEAGSLIRPLIRSLRRKLGYQAGELGCIENLRGVGYRLVPLE